MFCDKFTIICKECKLFGFFCNAIAGQNMDLYYEPGAGYIHLQAHFAPVIKVLPQIRKIFEN